MAINEDRDIAVAYHSSRPAITGAGGANIKQVELAYYEYQDIGGIETWVYLDTILLGSIDYSPILGLNQTSVRCERPDVVAVRDKFFVVWTRRYEDSLAPLQYPNQSEGPAVIECAWVEKASPQQTYKIQTYPDYRDPANPSPGLGYILDSHIVGTGLRDLLTKECLGVADAVPLSDDNDEYKVAVVYPHQTDFSGGGSNDREFDLRMITCSFDDALDTISKGPFVDLQQSIYFNGDTSPGPSPSAGLILPELAPSSVDNSFWIAYEMQTESGSLPNGRIRLEYYEMDSGNWATTFGTTFKSPPGLTPFVRRRPNISSYPPTSTSQGEQMVSITFNKRNPDPLAADQTANVVYREVAWQNGSNNHHLFVVTGWMNSTGFQDGKPTVIRGRDYPFIRRCFVDRLDTSVPKCDTISYDDITGVYSSRDSVPAPPGTIGRPAADYHFENGAASPDYIPLTWERKDIQADPLKIWLGVE